MRKLVAFVSVLLAACSMNSVHNTSKQVDEFGWIVASSQTESYPFEIRFREVPPNFEKKDYPFLIRVFWKMSNPASSGLASPDDIERMHAFENRLVTATEPKSISILTAVLTGNGEREFVFYARSRENFLNALTDMPQEEARYPVEIYAEDNASWSYYHNEVDHIK